MNNYVYKVLLTGTNYLLKVFASPPDMDPACAPFNLPRNATFNDCCQIKVQMIPSDVFQKCAAQFPKVRKILLILNNVYRTVMVNSYAVEH